MIIDGLPYYFVNGNAYIYTSTGYVVAVPPKEVVVQPPSVVVPAPAIPVAVTPAPGAPPAVASIPIAPPPMPAQPAAADKTFTVNIPNVRGTYTPVILTKSGTGFIGPQGEFYAEFPCVEQLKVMYGK